MSLWGGFATCSPASRSGCLEPFVSADLRILLSRHNNLPTLSHLQMRRIGSKCRHCARANRFKACGRRFHHIMHYWLSTGQVALNLMRRSHYTIVGLHAGETSQACSMQCHVVHYWFASISFGMFSNSSSPQQDVICATYDHFIVLEGNPRDFIL